MNLYHNDNELNNYNDCIAHSHTYSLLRVVLMRWYKVEKWYSSFASSECKYHIVLANVEPDSCVNVQSSLFNQEESTRPQLGADDVKLGQIGRLHSCGRIDTQVTIDYVARLDTHYFY